MKKLINTILFLISVPYLFSFSGGTGTESDPYQISNISDWLKLTDSVNVYDNIPANQNWSRGKYFELTQDIEDTIRHPVGESFYFTINKMFEGSFDGKGYSVIIGINYLRNMSRVIAAALFGRTANATIKNLTVYGFLNIPNYREAVAGIVGSSIGHIYLENCINFADITTTWTTASGIIALGSDITAVNCINAGTISSVGDINNNVLLYLSGIAARITSNIEYPSFINCLNIGDIIDNRINHQSYSQIGGIIASAHTNLVVNNCKNAGYIKSNNTYPTTTTATGGIVAYSSYSVTISNCINTGVVEGNVNAGAIAGNIEAGSSMTITNCHYDKQFCIYKGVNGQDVPGVSGHITRNMVGRKLANLLGDDDWTYVEGATLIECLYPQLKVFSESTDERRTDASKVGATPIFLYDGIKD